MPELPEVETLKRELSRSLVGKSIKKARVLWPKTVAPLSVKVFEKKVIGQKITKLERRAKMLVINFSGPLSLAIHLKMTGQLIFIPSKNYTCGTTVPHVYKLNTKKIIIGGHPAPKDERVLPNPHTRLIFDFTDNSKLYFNDLRKFGWVRLVDDELLDNLTKHLGLEPLSRLFTVESLADIFKRYPNRTIKQILLDQNLIAGIGNIYADESCFLAKLLPNKKAGTLKPAQIKKLHKSIIAVLKLSIQKKGTSSRNYRRSDGSLGGFVPYLYAYGRAGEPCKICQTKIEKIKHAGRGTHYCPHCQK